MPIFFNSLRESQPRMNTNGHEFRAFVYSCLFVFIRGYSVAMPSESLGQLIMTGIPGKEVDRETADVLRRVQPGAFILFGRNIESAPQLRKLIDDLRDIS